MINSESKIEGHLLDNIYFHLRSETIEEYYFLLCEFLYLPIVLHLLIYLTTLQGKYPDIF